MLICFRMIIFPPHLELGKTVEVVKHPSRIGQHHRNTPVPIVVLLLRGEQCLETIRAANLTFLSIVPYVHV